MLYFFQTIPESTEIKKEHDPNESNISGKYVNLKERGKKIDLICFYISAAT